MGELCNGINDELWRCKRLSSQSQIHLDNHDLTNSSFTYCEIIEDEILPQTS